jgi:hypothetical protein
MFYANLSWHQNETVQRKVPLGGRDLVRGVGPVRIRHEGVTASKTRVAVADSRYGNTANLIALAQRKIRVHVADLRSKMRNPLSTSLCSQPRLL